MGDQATGVDRQRDGAVTRAQPERAQHPDVRGGGGSALLTGSTVIVGHGRFPGSVVACGPRSAPYGAGARRAGGPRIAERARRNRTDTDGGRRLRVVSWDEDSPAVPTV
ncbi:hypothetical protein GCM10025792_35500 [Pseudonocardia tropica]